MIKRGGVFAIVLTATMIAGFEGLRTSSYLDSGGVPTICWGTTKGVKPGNQVTVTDCEELLFEDVVRYQREVRKRVTVPLTDNQLAALTSFTYNVGVAAFESSTLRRKLNAGDTAGACDELLRWRYTTIAGAKVELPGLVRRRNAERELCLAAASPAARSRVLPQVAQCPRGRGIAALGKISGFQGLHHQPGPIRVVSGLLGG